jgi:hypothetical protein
MTKNQRGPAEQQVPLTGSEFHKKKRKIIPASWVTVTLAVIVHHAPLASSHTMHPGRV